MCDGRASEAEGMALENEVKVPGWIDPEDKWKRVCLVS